MPPAFADLFLDDLESLGVPRDPDPEHLRLLAECYAATGERCDRDALILALAFPVYSIVKKYRYHRSADDLLGVALLELVESVARWRPTAGGGIRAYVEVGVRERIKDAIDEERNLLISPSGRRKRVAKGEEDWGPAIVPLDFDPLGSPSTFPDGRLIVQEFLATLGARDREILTLRLEGWSIAGIGTAIGRGERTVYHRLQTLQRAWARFAGPDG